MRRRNKLRNYKTSCPPQLNHKVIRIFLVLIYLRDIAGRNHENKSFLVVKYVFTVFNGKIANRVWKILKCSNKTYSLTIHSGLSSSNCGRTEEGSWGARTSSLHWPPNFELCFVFQLKYPSQCQTVCQIIQLHMLRYGDPESGTLTTMRKKQAQNKLQGYLLALGKISVEK